MPLKFNLISGYHYHYHYHL